MLLYKKDGVLRFLLLLFAIAISGTITLRAAAIAGGEMILDLDAAALAALNHGTNPDVGALILEEFFGFEYAAFCNAAA